MNTTNDIYDVVIIGSGPAGYNAGLYAVRAGLSALLLVGPEKGGQLTKTHRVDNWLGTDEVEPFELLDRMEAHAAKYGTQIVSDSCRAVIQEEGQFRLKGDDRDYLGRSVIVATGATAKYLGLPSEEKFKGRGVSACATCDGPFFKGQKVAVVGGGNTAIGEAMYLADIASHVTLIHRRGEFRAEKILVNRLKEYVAKGKISLKTPYVVSEVLGDDAGVTSLVLENAENHTKETIETLGLFVAIGHHPNTEFLNGLCEADENGFLLRGLRSKNADLGDSASSVRGVFVAGDVGDPRYRQAITAAAAGAQAAMDAKTYLDLFGS